MDDLYKALSMGHRNADTYIVLVVFYIELGLTAAKDRQGGYKCDIIQLICSKSDDTESLCKWD